MIRLLRNVLFLLPLFPPPVFSLDKLQKKLQPLCRRWLSRITTRADNKGHAVCYPFIFMTKICHLPAVTVWFIGKLHPEYILWVTPPISNPTFEQTLSISFDWLVNANIRHLSLIKNKDNFNMDSKCLFFLSYFL